MLTAVVGFGVGLAVAVGEGLAVVGFGVGFAVGFDVGFAVGFGVGFAVGFGVGFGEGFVVGLGDGLTLGLRVGVGRCVAAGSVGFREETDPLSSVEGFLWLVVSVTAAEFPEGGCPGPVAERVGAITDVRDASTELSVDGLDGAVDLTSSASPEVVAEPSTDAPPPVVDRERQAEPTERTKKSTTSRLRMRIDDSRPNNRSTRDRCGNRVELRLSEQARILLMLSIIPRSPNQKNGSGRRFV